MQPYFLPYIGYFQLMNHVDSFVVYDNIQYTKKGWINRNRILVNGNDEYISIPLQKDSDYLDIRNRVVSDKWVQESKKTLNRIREAYRKAPEVTRILPLVEQIVLFDERNLFSYVFHSLKIIAQYLDIQTPLIVSSNIAADHTLKGEQRVIAITKALGSDEYINPIGGTELYKKEIFQKEGINLSFLQSLKVPYSQLGNDFVPFLSILDVLMFNDRESVKTMLKKDYILI